MRTDTRRAIDYQVLMIVSLFLNCMREEVDMATRRLESIYQEPNA